MSITLLYNCFYCLQVTITVCAIVTCFTVTQGPSAAAAIYQSLHGAVSQSNTILYVLTTATSFLVVLGKTLNFILFCLSSANFRHRLLGMMKRRLRRRRQDSAFSMTSSRITHDTPMHHHPKRLSMSTTVYSHVLPDHTTTNNHHDTPPSSVVSTNHQQQSTHQHNDEPLIAISSLISKQQPPSSHIAAERRRSSAASSVSGGPTKKQWHRLSAIDRVLDIEKMNIERRQRRATNSGGGTQPNYDRRNSLLSKHQSNSTERAIQKRKSIV